MKTLDKETFQKFANAISDFGNLSFSLKYDSVTPETFCKALGEHDKELAVKVLAWAYASQEMREHVASRVEGRPQTQLTLAL